jgi:rubrerythrin
MNVREVLEIAVTMESDGMAFYKKAAAVIKDKTVSGLLLELAAWEKKHLELFSGMKDEILRLTDAIVDPDEQAELYLQAFVTGAVFDANANPLEYIKSDSRAQDVFKIAISLEKDAICYYLGIKQLLGGMAKEKVDAIIKEEMSHVRILTDELKKCKQ